MLAALGDTLIYSGERSPIEYAYALRNLDPENLTLVGLPGDSVTSGGALPRRGVAAGRAGSSSRRSRRTEPAGFLADHPELVNK